MSTLSIETSKVCHNCGHTWKLPYSVLKEIILMMRYAKNKSDDLNTKVPETLVIHKTCPSCKADMCVYHDNPEDVQPFIPKKNKLKALQCSIQGHDFKGNLRHSLYKCKKCSQLIRYKDAKITYLN